MITKKKLVRYYSNKLRKTEIYIAFNPSIYCVSIGSVVSEL